MRPKRPLVCAILISILFTSVAVNAPSPPNMQSDSANPAALENTLTWESIGTPDGLDPHVNWESFGAWIFRNVYETLFTCPFDSNETTPSIPLLAESVDISGDGLNYTFTLRQGILFHDLTPFNASCVYYNFMRILAIFDEFGPAWMLAEHVLGGQELEDAVYEYGMGSDEHGVVFMALRASEDTPFIVLDPYTFRIRLSEPYSPFLSILAHPLCSIISPTWIEKHGGVQIGEQNQYVREYTCGTGPYRIAEYKPDEDIILNEYPLYWRANEARFHYPWAGSIQTVIIRTNHDAVDRESNLVLGQTDGCYWPKQDAYDIYNGYTGDPGDGTLMSSNPNLKVWATQPALDTMFFGFNMHSTINNSGEVYENPYRMVSLRRALSYAFDRDAAINGVYDGFGIPMTGPIPKGMLGYSETVYPYYRNISAAVIHWNEAMDQGLDDILANNSYYLEIPIVATSSSIRVILAMLLKDCFETILDHPNATRPSENLTIEIVQYELPYYYYDLYQNNEIPIYFLGWMADYGDPDAYITPLIQSQSTYPRLLGLNESDGWDAAFADEIIKDSVESTDEAVRDDAYQILQFTVGEHAPYLWVCQITNFHVERADVYGYAFNPLFDPYFYYYRIGIYTSSVASSTTSTSTSSHNLYWGVDVGDRFDFTVSNTMTSELQDELYFLSDLESGTAYYIVENLPVIPSDVRYLFQVQGVIGTVYWNNGSEWGPDISSLSSVFVLPIGDWEFLTPLITAQNPEVQIIDAASYWGFRQGSSMLNYSLRGLVLYEKNSGWLSQYLIEIFDSTNTTKLAEFEIRSLSYNPSSSSPSGDGLTLAQIISIISWSVTFASLGVIVVLSVLIIKHRRVAG